jgi:hypothetical protein
MGVLYLDATKTRWESFDAEERCAGVRYSGRFLVGGTSLLVGAIVTILRHPTDMNDGFTLAIVGAGGTVAWRLFAARFVKPGAMVAEGLRTEPR